MMHTNDKIPSRFVSACLLWGALILIGTVGILLIDRIEYIKETNGVRGFLAFAIAIITNFIAIYTLSIHAGHSPRVGSFEPRLILMWLPITLYFQYKGKFSPVFDATMIFCFCFLTLIGFMYVYQRNIDSENNL